MRIVDLTLLLSLTSLIAIMNTFGSGAARYGALAFYGVLFVTAALPRSMKLVGACCDLLNGRARSAAYIWMLFVGLTLVTYLRAWGDPVLRASAMPSALFFLTIAVVGASVVRDAATRTKDSHLRAILYSTHVFVLINMGAYFLGFRGHREFVNAGNYGQAQVLGLLGLDVERTLLPLSPGLTTFGVLAGASAVVAMVGVRSLGGWERWWNALVLPLAILGLLVTDSRGSMLFFGTAAALYVLVLGPGGLRAAKFLLVPTSALFMVLLVLSGIVAGSGGFNDLSRGALLLSGREVVWVSALSFMAELPSGLLMGFGYMGHYVSGVSVGYSDYFANWGGESAEFFTLHNFVLQLLFDSGVLGLSVALTLMALALGQLARLASLMGPTAMMTSMYLLYVVVSGATESSFSVYSLLTLSPILLVTAYLAFRQSPPDSSPHWDRRLVPEVSPKLAGARPNMEAELEPMRLRTER